MADSGLTQEQKIQLDNITPIFADDHVAKMTRHELKNYRELLTVRDQVEQSFVSQNAMAPETPAVAVLTEVPDDLKPTPLPTEAQKPTELPKAPAAEAQAATDIPAEAPVYSAEEQAMWEQKLQKMEDRYKHLQASISPTQQKAATLRKKLDMTEGAVSELEEKLEARFQRLEELMLASRRDTDHKPIEFEVATDLSNLDPDLERRLRAMEASMNARVAQIQKQSEENIRRMQEDQQRREEEAAKAEWQAHVVQHDAEVRRLVPDFDNIVRVRESFDALAAWMAQQPSMIRNVLASPYQHTPFDVAYALSQFKASRQPASSAKQPSLGDLAASAKLAPPTPLTEMASSQGLLTDEEVANIETLMHQTVRKGGDPSELLDRYERTLLAKQKQNAFRK